MPKKKTTKKKAAKKKTTKKKVVKVKVRQLGAESTPVDVTVSRRSVGAQLTGQIKNLRVDLDAKANEIEALIPLVREGQPELTLAKRRLQEGRMWLGQVLGKLGVELPPEYADKAGNAPKETRPTRR